MTPTVVETRNASVSTKFYDGGLLTTIEVELEAMDGQRDRTCQRLS